MEDNSTPSTNGSDLNGETSNQENDLQMDGDNVNEDLLSDLLNDIRIDHSLQSPDMTAVKRESYKRTRAAMVAIHPTIAKKILPEHDHLSREESAAICIQAYTRGHLARKKYVQLLYELFEKEEEERHQRIQQQLEEGEILIDNYRLSCEMDQNACLRRNLRRNVDCSAVTIQRAWREHKRKSQGELYTGSNAYKPNFALSLQEPLHQTQPSFHIRTNPFSGQDCDDLDDGHSDVFNDSLEQVMEENNYKNKQEHGPAQENLNAEEYFDNYLYGDESLGLDSAPVDLLSPTTDWESIESCLTSEGETQDFDNSDLGDLTDKRLTDFTFKANNLQICFVDDDVLSSDAEDAEDECEIKEYIIDKQELSEDEKRDSGCVAGDDEGSETFSIKTVSHEALVNTNISSEDSTKVMLELSRQVSEEEEEKTKECLYQGWTQERLQELTVEELRELRNNMAQLIAAQNEVLVRELMNRDCLHLKQDSLLMEVEDSSKLAQAQHKMAQKAKQRT